MSSVLYSLGHWVVRRRRLVVTLWAAGLIVLGALAGLLQQGMNDVFSIPGTQSQQATDALSARFPQFAGASGQVVVSAPTGTQVTDATVRAQIEDLTTRYAALPHVSTAASPFNERIRGAVSPDGSTAIIAVQLDVGAAEVTPEMRDPLVQLAETATSQGLPTVVGGALFMPTAPEMSIMEGVGVLLAMLVLLATFGSALAAGIPLLVSLLGVATSMSVILIATRFTEITSTAPFLALMIGLAVGIDYALFVLSRHRDLLAEGLDPAEAAAQATGTAGSAVIFAGATVAIALAALGVAGVPFLTVMGIAGAVGVGGAVLAALTFLPAILGFAGARLTPRRVGAAYHERRDRGWPARWVRAVTRAPLLTVVVVAVGLGAAALPLRDLALALPTNGTSTPESTQRQAYDRIAQAFGPGANAPLVITLDIVATTDPLGVVAEVERMILATDGIVATTVATPNQGADTGVIVAIPAGSATSAQTHDALMGVRALAPEVEQRFGVDLAVTGQTAAQVDVSDRLAEALLPFGIVVVGLSLVLLTLVFRSILVPLTAALGYLLSLGAAFGSIVAIFQWGWLSGPFGVEQPGPIIAFMPIILMGVLFGLAMDYEVFLVASMRARFVHEGNARAAVHSGFVDAARVVTAAAIIMVSVFAAFVPHGAVYIKPIALGLAVGVFVDAFIVRMTLVTALMHLLGEKAWWLPRWLDRILPSLDVEGESLHRRLDADRARAGRPPLAISAHGLGLGDSDGTVFDGVDLAVPPRSVLVAHGAPGGGKTSLLLILAGRMTHTAGELEVAAHLLPDQAGAVRRLTSLAEIAGVNDLDPLLTVEDHLTERLSSTSWHPWVSSAARTRAERTFADLLTQACSAVPAAHARPTVALGTRVRDLQPLERWLLGVSLALVGDPQVLLVDDVDRLRGADDRAAAWAVLAALPRVPSAGPDDVGGRDGRDEPLAEGPAERAGGAGREGGAGLAGDLGFPAAGQRGRHTRRRPLTVVATCRDVDDARAALRGIPVVELPLASRSAEADVFALAHHVGDPLTEPVVESPQKVR